MLALAAVAAGALMAFIGAGTASATVLCSTTVTPCPTGQDLVAGTKIDFSIPSGSSASLVDTKGNALDKCTTSTVKGELTKTGGATSTPTGDVSELTWGGCTFPTKTLKTAALEIHQIAGTSNGTVTSDEVAGGNPRFEVTINTVLFGSCVYGVDPGTSIGDLVEGKPAHFTANAVAKKLGGGASCPETAVWTATYVMTEPSNTTISVEPE
jgi:hypothetical protein